jgi:hypothetical protein
MMVPRTPFPERVKRIRFSSDHPCIGFLIGPPGRMKNANALAGSACVKLHSRHRSGYYRAQEIEP